MLAYDARVDDVFDALGAPARRAILDALSIRDDQTLFEIVTRLVMDHEIDITRQAVSQHLHVLEATGLVRSRRDGRYKYHTIDTAPLQVAMSRWLTKESTHMRIHLSSVFVDDQDHALDFYTRILGFEARADVPLGNGDRWLTVGAPGEHHVELLLEPSSHPAVAPYRAALADDGIPVTAFAVDDVETEHERLTQLGVVFTQPPIDHGTVTTAVFDDTCGNLIQIATQP
jgi:DNA-binding transcriptional ArsR family regulator